MTAGAAGIGAGGNTASGGSAGNTAGGSGSGGASGTAGTGAAASGGNGGAGNIGGGGSAGSGGSAGTANAGGMGPGGTGGSGAGTGGTGTSGTGGAIGEAWTREFGSSDHDYAYAVAVDKDDNIFVGGDTRGVLAAPSQGGYDGYIRKYDRLGGVVWTRQFGSNEFDYGTWIATDSTGGVALAGHTAGAFPGKTAAGGTDAFVCRYDSTGNLNWTDQVGSSTDDQALGVTFDSAGNAVFGGGTSGVLPGKTSAGDKDAFLRKLSPTGSEIWTIQFGTSGAERLGAVALDGSDNIYCAGGTDGAFPGFTNTGDFDVVLVKLDASGGALWTRQFGTTSHDLGFGIAVDAIGNAVVVG